MRNEEYGKDYVHRILTRIKWIIILFIILLVIGLLIGSAMGGSNPLIVFWPPTWVHIFSFLH